jgi:formate dehydrogenase maturation protein FdhE
MKQPLAKNGGDNRCPTCSSSDVERSDDGDSAVGEGVIYWQCNVCGYEWITVENREEEKDVT